MLNLIEKRWVRLGTGSLVLATLVFGLSFFMSTQIGSDSSASYDVEFLALGGPDFSGFEQTLPSSVGDAISESWYGSIRCLPGQGRFYRKLIGAAPDPLMLLFDANDRLIGLNLHSADRQPIPWRHFLNGLEAGVGGRETEYWDLTIFIVNSANACKTANDSGRRERW